MSNLDVQNALLVQVAVALGPELCKEMTFVGGCTTGLLLTDAFTKEQVRHTDDVDLIVHVMGYADYAKLQEALHQRKFSIVMPEDDDVPPICAMQLGDLRVDIMPDDEAILGFSNRWYSEAIKSAQDYPLTAEIIIKLVHPVMFVATKLEAWNGRGNGDALTSRDIEDILHLVDGRPELVAEIAQSQQEVRAFISVELARLIEDSNFEMAVSSQANTAEREDVIYERLEEIIASGVQ
ncbi:hypothetical protein KK010_17350 [Enterobacter mori]|uniref:hypothetical protein n=1 Tax=Enterobacter mori TaxID=539813 RepID=UPI0015DC5826|nr:hypothetical protein [Enterobacter mori]MBT1871691.1 hypothetical protein [Enterobacter mori]BBT92721.1 hypothetical protein WP8W19C02_43410 [Enterobacter cloacae]